MNAWQRRLAAHEHECQSCGNEFPCAGLLEPNYDGHPEVICRQYHEHGVNVCINCQEGTADTGESSADGVR